ncbi:MAG: RluA family pseudouridine synthase [Deltaproteobacteria bacterium]|nr:RluA family pseudouridine synthase [Deltaproteobacteria bacterium]
MSAPVLASHIVPDLEEAVRLDKYLVDTFSLFPSRASARKAARRGEVLVDGEPRRSGSFVESGHHIEVLQPVRAPPRPWHLPLELAFVDDWMAVVVKPPGVMVRGNHYRTLENALVATLPPSAAAGALRWANPVHRLDVRTGGLLLVARTGPAQVALGQMLEERSITKRYRALALGRLEGKGTVREPIEGRDAVSDWRAVAHTRCLRTDWLTTVDLWPRTGRTHQLRRHLRHLDHPVLGDDLYGTPDCILRGKGLFLWSVEVALSHPVTGIPMQVTIDEPPKFGTFRAREERRWARYRPGASG